MSPEILAGDGLVCYLYDAHQHSPHQPPHRHVRVSLEINSRFVYILSILSVPTWNLAQPDSMSGRQVRV